MKTSFVFRGEEKILGRYIRFRFWKNVCVIPSFKGSESRVDGRNARQRNISFYAF